MIIGSGVADTEANTGGSGNRRGGRDGPDLEGVAGGRGWGDLRHLDAAHRGQGCMGRRKQPVSFPTRKNWKLQKRENIEKSTNRNNGNITRPKLANYNHDY